MTAAAYIDSGAFIAFLDRSDNVHEETALLFASPPPRLVTSILVVAETHGWFLHRLGEEAGRTFLSLIDRLSGLAVLAPDRQHHEAVRRKLDRHRGRKLTYVDASSLAMLEEHRIRRVWCCDPDLAIEGATLHPGPPRD